MQELSLKALSVVRSKNKTLKTRPCSDSINNNWQQEDWKAPKVTEPYRCVCRICYKQRLRIPGVLVDRYPTRINVGRTKLLFSYLAAKGDIRGLNILMVDSCFYSNGKPQRIYYTDKGVVRKYKSKDITQKYVFNRLVEETKIENNEDKGSLLSRKSNADNLIPVVNSRYCNVLLPPWSQFNEILNNTFNIRVYKKGNAPEMSLRKSSEISYSAVIYFKDETLVLVGQNYFDKMMKDRREGNPHVVFIQSYVRSKLSSKENYYGIVNTCYKVGDTVDEELFTSARSNILKYLQKDPFATDQVNEDTLSIQELAIFFTYRIVHYLKQEHNIVVQSIALAWMYSVTSELLLSFASEFQYEFEAGGTRPQLIKRDKSIKKPLQDPLNETAKMLVSHWESVKARHLGESVQRVQHEKKMYTDKSELIFKEMFPQGNFKTLRTSSSRCTKTADSIRKKPSVLTNQLKTVSSVSRWAQSRTIGFVDYFK